MLRARFAITGGDEEKKRARGSVGVPKLALMELEECVGCGGAKRGEEIFQKCRMLERLKVCHNIPRNYLVQKRLQH